MVNPGASSDPSSARNNSGLSHDSESEPDRFDLEQMLSLVDTILPFEACLYYQVLPLSLNSSQLILGIVNADDTAATDYVRRQLAYIHYSLVTCQISSNWHRDMLSQYLSHKSKAKPKPSPSSSAVSGPGVQSASQSSSADIPFEEATFIVDSPTLIPTDFRTAPASTPANGRSTAEPASKSNVPHQDQAKPVAQVTPSASPKKSAATPVSPSRSNPTPQTATPTKHNNQQQPLDLNLPVTPQPISLDSLGKLPPRALTQALLKRVLQNGIGRLHFERRETKGRILWSKDGVVQAVLDDLPLPLFQSVINELKRLTHLPLITTQETRKVEIERTYKQERVVLRFRLIASPNGEEATLQVLRGAALKFYQQQQIDQLGQDALTFAHRLQSQVDQIRDRARQAFSLEGVSTTTLTTISHLLKDIDSEINQIIQKNQGE
jgi:type II secretory ATPase GspE/PulE/Tfp pilus assembly ATPase PilB-like protein